MFGTETEIGQTWHPARPVQVLHAVPDTLGQVPVQDMEQGPTAKMVTGLGKFNESWGVFIWDLTNQKWG